MPIRAIKSIAWLWIASLFIATVGVSGQQIYCYCKGQTTFSIFAVEEDCTDLEKGLAKSCCSTPTGKPSSSCCKNDGAAKPTNSCTKKTTKVFQLKTEFTTQEKATEKLSLPSIGQDIEAVPAPGFKNVFCSQIIKPQLFAKPPPPISGRMICVRYGVFRC